MLFSSKRFSVLLNLVFILNQNSILSTEKKAQDEKNRYDEKQVNYDQKRQTK